MRYLCVLLGAMLLLMAGQCAVSPRQIVLRELLNQRYGSELVYYPFTAGQHECRADGVQVTGANGRVPAQLTAVTYWGNTPYVKSAQLAILAPELAPLATLNYTVVPGNTKAPALKTDLEVTAGEHAVDVATSRIGIRLLLGAETYATPQPAVQVPGLLQGMRVSDGAWQGGSAFTGEDTVTSWSAALTDQGPAFARVESRYVFSSGTKLLLAATVVAGDTAIRWEMTVEGDKPDVALRLRLLNVPGVKEALLPKGYGQWARDRKLALTPSEMPCCFLSPDTSIVNINVDSPPIIRLVGERGLELLLRSRDPGAWVDPVAPMSYAGFKYWNWDMTEGSWEFIKRKRIPLSYLADGGVLMQLTLARGQRKWSVSAGDPAVGEKLTRVKEMVLDWPQKTQHPHLFMNRAELEEAWKRVPPEQKSIDTALSQRGTLSIATQAYLFSGCRHDVGVKAEVVANLKHFLELQGYFDVMRHAEMVEGAYDAVIDSDLVTPQERTVLRAQMAYLGYLMADPMCWSMERGYMSGNPNMSISYTLSLGMLACLLPDHPMAKTWASYCERWMEKWLADEIGSEGEWLSEGDSYGGFVSVPPLLSYAVTAKRAGYHDYTNDPRLKKLMLYIARKYTPPDPRRNNLRVSPPLGRGNGWQTIGTLGLAAKMTVTTDPAFSRALQWLWAKGNYSLHVGDTRLAGFEPLYLDKTLPAEAPKWGTVCYPALGAVLRDGFDTPSEHYLLFISHVQSRHNLDIWVPDIGALAAWFAYGKPVSEILNYKGGYYEQHELTRNGVMLARNYDGAGNGKAPFGYYTVTLPGPMTALPGADYLRAGYRITKPDTRDWFPDSMPAWPKLTPATEAKLTWIRQALFVKDTDPAGPHWLLLRDTTTGGQPTAWQFWTLSEKLGTPEQARDAAFLADKPGKSMLPARALPAGDRYTAVGQFDVDLEYFVAGPKDTPRHTLRYGGSSYFGTEYQDLLHLQLPGDGAYYVAVYPHQRTEPMPAFAVLGEGKIVKVAGAFGTDYAFLAENDTTATEVGITFTGTAGAIAVRPAMTTLTLSAPGEVRFHDLALHAPMPAALRVQPGMLSLTFPANNPGGAVTLTAQAGWQVKTAGIRCVTNGMSYTFTVPAGIVWVEMRK